MSEDKERDLENQMICVKERDHGHDKHSVALLEFYFTFFHRLGRSHCICHVVEVSVVSAWYFYRIYAALWLCSGHLM